MCILICLMAVLVQQTIVAFTTVAIAWTASAVSTGGDPLPQLIFFCSLLLATALPQILIDLESERSKYWLFNRAIKKSSAGNYGATGSFFNKHIRSEKESYVDSELWITISDDVAYATDAMAVLLNIAFNALAVSSVPDASFSISLVAACIISLASSIISLLQNIGVVVSYATQLSERIARTKLVYSNLVLTDAERNTHGVIK